MPRPRKHRCCRRYRNNRVYKPQGIPLSELNITELAADEFEALRLCDFEGMDQSEAGQIIGVSRGTVQRLLKNGRQKLIKAFVGHEAITILLNQEETK
ncbi:MAG: DUF134 domain-containing protein [bacterium]|nr:DUF134 domain-containing protein [bacterium]